MSLILVKLRYSMFFAFMFTMKNKVECKTNTCDSLHILPWSILLTIVAYGTLIFPTYMINLGFMLDVLY